MNTWDETDKIAGTWQLGKLLARWIGEGAKVSICNARVSVEYEGGKEEIQIIANHSADVLDSVDSLLDLDSRARAARL